MTERQLYASVVSGQKITFHVFDGDPIDGYLAGMDGERFFVLEPVGHERATFRKQFVDRRSGSPVFEIHSDRAYRDEPAREAMDEIIGSFRKWISLNIMNRREKVRHPSRPLREREAS